MYVLVDLIESEPNMFVKLMDFLGRNRMKFMVVQNRTELCECDSKKEKRPVKKARGNASNSTTSTASCSLSRSSPTLPLAPDSVLLSDVDGECEQKPSTSLSSEGYNAAGESKVPSAPTATVIIEDYGTVKVEPECQMSMPDSSMLCKMNESPQRGPIEASYKHCSKDISLLRTLELVQGQPTYFGRIATLPEVTASCSIYYIVDRDSVQGNEFDHFSPWSGQKGNILKKLKYEYLSVDAFRPNGCEAVGSVIKSVRGEHPRIDGLKRVVRFEVDDQRRPVSHYFVMYTFEKTFDFAQYEQGNNMIQSVMDSLFPHSE